MLGALLAALDGGAVSIASQLWVQRGLPIRPELRAIAEGRYRAEVAALDFGRPAEAAEATRGACETNAGGGTTRGDASRASSDARGAERATCSRRE